MKIWILIFSSALFVAGTCLGVALQPKIAPAPNAEVKTDSAPPPAWGAQHHSPQFSVHRFAAELQLSDEQDRELDAILSDSQEDSQTLGRLMRASQEKTRDRIVGILTPLQKIQLDTLMAAERQKRADSEIARTVASYTKILSLNDTESQALRAALTETRGRRHETKRGEDWQQIRKSSREEQNKKLQDAFSPEHFKRYLEVSELERSER